MRRQLLSTFVLNSLILQKLTAVDTLSCSLVEDIRKSVVALSENGRTERQAAPGVDHNLLNTWMIESCEVSVLTNARRDKGAIGIASPIATLLVSPNRDGHLREIEAVS